MKPLISIIIPVYNVEQYLHRCVDSVLNQTYKNLEIILVNDGSPDNCPFICDEYAKKDKRIIVVHKKNGGLSSARNEGIQKSQGDWLLFLDSDDLLNDSDNLQNISEIISNNKTDTYFFSNIIEFSSHTKHKPHSGLENKMYNSSSLYKACIKKNIYFCAPMFICRRQFILHNKLFFYENIVHEDMEWVPRLMASSKNIFHSNFPWYLYSVNREGSITYTYTHKNFDSMSKVLDSLLLQLGLTHSKIGKQIYKMWLTGNYYSLVLGLLFFYKNDDKNFSNYKQATLRYSSLLLKNKTIKNIVLYIFIKIFGIKSLLKILIYFKKGENL